MKRPPYWTVVTASATRHWVRLKGGNHAIVLAGETVRRPGIAQAAVTTARVAVAVELAEALRNYRGDVEGTNLSQFWLDWTADLLVPLAESLPPVAVETPRSAG